MRRLSYLLLGLFVPGLSHAAVEPKYKLSDIPTDKEKALRENKAGPHDDVQPPNTTELANQIADEFYDKGIKALNEGNLDLAEGYFDRVLILKPHHKGAQDGIDAIMKAYEQPATAMPNGPARVDLIKSLEKDMNKKLEEGDREGAEDVADEILAIDPEHAEARLKQRLIRRQFFDEAVAQASDQESQGDLRGALNSLRVALSYKKDGTIRARIKELKEKLVQNNNTESDRLYVEALTASQNGETEKAVSLCRQAIAANPSNYQAQRMLDRLSQKNPPLSR
jgi:tetratricopeptide (TPR) repeat protein